MIIAHGGISALQRKQLEKMPVHNYADGGDVSIATDPNKAAIPESLAANPNAEPSQQDINYAPLLKQEESDNAPFGTAPDNKNDVAPIGPSPASVDQPAPVAAAKLPGTAGTGFDLNSAYQQGQNAISEQQKVSSDLSKANADILNKNIADKQALQDAFKKNSDGFMAQQQHLMNDYANNHIDPHHYVENMSVPSKIASAIGMILGGAGAGAGRPNPGAEFLNKQIDRDIAGQQATMDQRKTLLGANQAIFHDQLLAQNQTRVNMNDIYDHQIQMAAANLGTPQAKAQADAAHSNFAIQNASLVQENALRKTVMDHLQNGGGGINAIDLAKAKMMPEGDAIKEQASIDAQNMAIQKTRELFKGLNDEQTWGNIINPQSSRRVDAMNSELVNAVMNASASKRLTEESVKKEIAPLQILTTDDDKTRQAKLQGVLNIIQRHADPTPYMTRYSPQSLPNYGQPQEPQYKTVNGVKYMRGPRGEAIAVK